MGIGGIVIFAFIGIILLCVLISKITEQTKSLAQKEENLIERIQLEEKNQIKEYEKLNLQLQKEIDYNKKCIKDFDDIIEKKCNYYPQLSVIMADLQTLYYERSAEFLDSKHPPAHIEAQRIRELREQTKQLLAGKKLLEYKLAYIYELYPDINKIFDDGFDSTTAPEINEFTNDDKVRDYLSKEEYDRLNTTQRNQLALDRYVSNRKSKWQVGRDYEMYVGYKYSLKDYNIEYSGIIKKLEDMGRDLIAKKNEEILIIQCKNWAQDKIIHEKHIFQLYGTVVLYQINTLYKVKGIFITSTALSEKAKLVANYLNIEIIENYPLGQFPRIKCNINRQTQEKIYHLPFDQQYDKTVIEPKKGEFYAYTVEEAESQGFRRAFKHKGKK